MDEPVVSISREVMSGTPVFFGTRVPVKNLIDYIAGGETIDEFLNQFPSVTREQVMRFLDGAQDLMIAQANADID